MKMIIRPPIHVSVEHHGPLSPCQFFSSLFCHLPDIMSTHQLVEFRKAEATFIPAQPSTILLSTWA